MRGDAPPLANMPVDVTLAPWLESRQVEPSRKSAERKLSTLKIVTFSNPRRTAARDSR